MLIQVAMLPADAALAGRLSTADWPLLEAAASAVAQLVTSQTRLAFACLQVGLLALSLPVNTG